MLDGPIVVLDRNVWKDDLVKFFDVMAYYLDDSGLVAVLHSRSSTCWQFGGLHLLESLFMSKN